MKIIFVYLKVQFEDNLFGVMIKVKNMFLKSVIQLIFDGNYDLLLVVWMFDFKDLWMYSSLFLFDYFNNYMSYNSFVYDKFVKLIDIIFVMKFEECWNVFVVFEKVLFDDDVVILLFY